MMSGDIALNCKSLFPSHFSLCWVASLQQGYFTFIKNSLCMSGLLHREKMRARGRGNGLMWVCVLRGGGGLLLEMTTVCSIWTCLAFTLTTGLNAYRALILAVRLCSENMGESFKSFHITPARRSPPSSAQQSVSQSLLWTFNIPAVLTFNKGRKNLLDPAAVCQVKGCPALTEHSGSVRHYIRL